MHKKPEVDLKLKYRRVFELSLLITFLLLTIIFLSFKKFEFERQIVEAPDMQFEIADIPKTEQVKRPPPPSRPTIPVESDDPELADDVTIEDTDIDLLEDIPTLPPPPKIEEEEEEEIPTFLPLEDQPKLIGGLESIYKYLEYPEIAKKAQVEGTVVVMIVVGKTGLPDEVTVLKTSGNKSLDDAAVAACKKGARYIPAKQRGKPVRYRRSHPIIFRLVDDK